jgi:hypothetical protein
MDASQPFFLVSRQIHNLGSLYEASELSRKQLSPLTQNSFFALSYKREGGPGERRRRSDSLQTGKSGNRNLMEARFSATVKTGSEDHTTSRTMVTRSL